MMLSTNGVDSLNQSLKRVNKLDTTCYTRKQREALNYIIESWKFLKIENKDLYESKKALNKAYTECIIQRDSYQAQVSIMKTNEGKYKEIIGLKDDSIEKEKKLTKFYKVSAQVFGGLTIGLGISTFILIVLR